MLLCSADSGPASARQPSANLPSGRATIAPFSGRRYPFLVKTTRRQLLLAALAGAAAPVPAWARAIGASAGSGVDHRFAAARAALELHADRIVHRDRVAIADFGLPSRAPRFFVLDMIGGGVTAHLVSHGRGSDPRHSGWLERFSNEPGSAATSAGAYVTAHQYVGQHGSARRLHGLEPSNEAAERRAIVIHAAWYVDPKMVADHGKIGRSEGCFAFSERDLPEIMERLGAGRLLLAGRFQPT